MGKITLLLSGAAPRDIPLTKRQLSIGRRSHNDVRIDDPAVSGEHAVIVRIGEDAVLEDLDSTNGTKVNGQPVKKHFLQDGDVVELALHRMVYHARAGTEDPAAIPEVPVIEVSSGLNAGRRTPLDKSITTISAGPEAGLLIVRRAGNFYILPSGGAAATSVNGDVVAPSGRPLRHGDMITFAGALLKFICPAGIE